MFLYEKPDFSQIDLCIDKVCKNEFDFIKLIGGTDMEYFQISQNLYKIGDGGDGNNCFVCCTPFTNKVNDNDTQSRFIASQQILKSLN